MSTKTIKQRIALVAVTALTAGLFTVVSAPVANATLGTSQVSGTLVIDTDAPVGTAAAAASVNVGTGTSRGWVADTSAVAATVVGTGATLSNSVSVGQAKTAAVLTNAILSFQANSVTATTSGVTVVVTGGTLGSVVATTTNVKTAATVAEGISINGDATAASVFALSTSTNGAAGEDITLAGLFTITAAAGGTATLAAYTGAGILGTTSRTAGSLIGFWTFTVTAAGVGAVYNDALSTVTQQACVAKTSAASGTNAFDTTSRCANGRNGVIYANLKDAYNTNITTGTFTATATGGALVHVTTATPAAGDNYAPVAAFSSVTPGAANYVYITQPVANTAGTSTVTLTHNGTVIGTKTITWAGDAATIVVDTVNSATIIRNGTDAAAGATRPQLGQVFYAVKDAAGNVVSTTTRPSISNATGSMVNASITTSVGGAALPTTAAGGAAQGIITQSIGLGYGVDTIDLPSSSAAANRGAGSYKLKWLKADGTPIYSQEVKVNVSYTASGVPNSFTASWDKASYTPGEIATLTISAKDAYGQLIADQTALTGLSLISGSNITWVGSECTAASTLTAGSKTCKFAVGNTAGSYAWSVKITTDVDQAALVGTNKVTDGAVSNADVLKSIVALIASINKQIAALQKLILKR